MQLNGLKQSKVETILPGNLGGVTIHVIHVVSSLILT